MKSNIAACHLKLEEWKETTNTASEAINDLEKLEPKKPVKEPKQGEDGEEIVEEAEEEVEEIISAGAAKAADTSESSKRKADIERMKSKALLRRARARSELGGWSNLAGAEEDYRVLSAMSCLTSTDKKVVQQQLRALPPRVKAAQEVEMGEMMGKLKQLGNGLLKPFGLSTDMFNMVKDEKTGGYSMNFNQGGGK